MRSGGPEGNRRRPRNDVVGSGRHRSTPSAFTAICRPASACSSSITTVRRATTSAPRAMRRAKLRARAQDRQFCGLTDAPPGCGAGAITIGGGKGGAVSRLSFCALLAGNGFGAGTLAAGATLLSRFSGCAGETARRGNAAAQAAQASAAPLRFPSAASPDVRPPATSASRSAPIRRSLRDGEATGPRSAMKISGRAPAASLDPDNTRRASSVPSVRSTLPASDRCGFLAVDMHIVQPHLAGADGNARFGALDRKLAALQRLAHDIGNTRGVDRQALIDRAGNGIEGARIEPGQLRVRQRDLAGAVQANRSAPPDLIPRLRARLKDRARRSPAGAPARATAATHRRRLSDSLACAVNPLPASLKAMRPARRPPASTPAMSSSVSSSLPN